MTIVVTLHSIVRWLIVILAVVALVKFGVAFARRRSPDNMDRGLMSGFSGLIDLQALLGIILILWISLTGGPFLNFLPHVITMVIAVMVAHLPMRWRRENNMNVLRNNLLTMVAVLVLVVIGVSLLPQGWFGA